MQGLATDMMVGKEAQLCTGSGVVPTHYL